MYKPNENKQITKLLEFANQIIDGNYSYVPDKEQFTGIYQNMYDSIFTLGKKMRRYVFEVQVASSQVLSATDELSVGIDESNRLTQELFYDAEEIQHLNTNSQAVMLTSMNELKQIANVLNEVNSTSDQVKTASEQSSMVLQESKNEILEIVDSVNNIKHSTDNTAEYIRKLEKSTKEIDDILKTVSNISRQIKIIALNAAIESARLGTAGRAFSVITDHIKTLSSKTDAEVEQINHIIAAISDDMEHLDAQMKQDISCVEKSVDCTKNVENSLERIEQSHIDVQSMVQTIITATAEESKLADEINNKVSDVENISNQVSNGFAQLFESISNQKENFKELAVLGTCLFDASNSLSILNDKADVNLIEENAAKFSKQAKSIFKIFKDYVLSSPNFNNLQEIEHKNKLDKILSENNLIEAIWTNNHKGKFIYSNPPAGIANAKVREWFKHSMTGQQYISEMYISAITKNPCVTVSMPIYDKNKQIIGVIGADLKLKV